MEDHRSRGVSVAYKVLAPCVILENEEGVRREVYQGAVVEILPKQVDHLLGLGFRREERDCRRGHPTGGRGRSR
jgi:hypothetical protein